MSTYWDNLIEKFRDLEVYPHDPLQIKYIGKLK